MNNGQTRTAQEKKDYLFDSLAMGLNPYNRLSPCGKNQNGLMPIRHQVFHKRKVKNSKKTKFYSFVHSSVNKVIKHFN